ncbi:MAG: glycosyltransferase [Bryobacterales bacterium]|nr:glycosyltransferase [Bryobacterales bacterium]
MPRSRPNPMRTVYVDMRCLQDPAFRERGIGGHVASMLRARAASGLSGARVVGLLDPELPKLPEGLRALCDATTFCLNPITVPAIRDVYIQTSPMTHDIADTWSFRRGRGFLSAAVVYDFIPLDWPGYLETKASRIDYLAGLARLRTYDCYLPISNCTARRLQELTGVSDRQMDVTGAAVRDSLVAAAMASQAGNPPNGRGGTGEPYALVVGGEDRRKNVTAAIEALRMVRQEGVAIGLKVVGNYTEVAQRDLQDACQGDWMAFLPDLTDEQLASVYSRAAVCLVPSHIEGFSLPVVEAAECGCPVLASRCAAHLELLNADEALFEADDPGGLADRLRAVLREPGLREKLLRQQAHLVGQFRELQVGERFWGGIARALTAAREGRSTFSVGRSRLPRLAFLSPYPPDQSGVAQYTEGTLAAATKRFDVSLYSDAAGPLSLAPRVRHAGPLTAAPLIQGDYDAVLLVLGNSHLHTTILDIAERFGGPTILHDSRLTQIYHHRLGRTAFRALAAKLLSRPVLDTEIERWLRDDDPPTLFIEPILSRCHPLLVHSRPLQRLIRSKYGVESQLVPFVPSRSFSAAEVAEDNRVSVRTKLGLAPGSFVISTFGHVEPSKNPMACIVAVELLRAWKIPAECWFVGRAGQFAPELRRVAERFGVADHIHLFEDYVTEETYRDYLIASDAAIQLRNHALGQVSAALADCASAGLPTVAPATLIEACAVPAYCRGLAELDSPLQLAEALAEIAAGARSASRNSEARQAYVRENTFDGYVKVLAEVLGYA